MGPFPIGVLILEIHESKSCRVSLRLLKKIDSLPDHQVQLCMRFKNWLVEENDNTERNWINYLKILNLFAGHIGNKRFEEITREDVLSFLDQRKKSSGERLQ